MSRVRVLHRDIIFVSNARAVEMEKFLTMVGRIYGTIRGPVALTQID